jgi:NAD(P)-dependent dehydrogenase (short-subunit alcohol dehydrogenase family)
MLNGKRIVVLGGTQGIGLAVAKRAGAQGGAIVVASSRQSSVDAALKELPKGSSGHAVDLRSERAVSELFSRIGAFDHLVYTAGEPLLLSKLSDLDFGQAQEFWKLRYWGALAAVKAAAPHLRRDGSIVLTSGAAGVRPHPGFVIGASICGAMDSLTRALAVELAPIRVNIVTPGFVDTGLWSNVPEGARKEMFAEAAKKLPVGRVANADDIAEHYLGFMNGAYVTGQSLIVDGGGVLV